MTTTNGQPPETALAPRPQPPGLEPPAQYATGFEGMAVAPFPKEAIIALTAPIEPEKIEVKPDGIVYLPGVWYRQRLTAAFGPGGWSLAPRGPSRVRGDLVTYHGALYALGRFVSEAVGECQYHESNRAMSYASALEGARTDCLTRCCKDLLVAMELWDPGFREKWLAEWAVFAFVDGKPYHFRRDRPVPYKAKGKETQPARVLPEDPPAPKGPRSVAAASPTQPASAAGHGDGPKGPARAPATSAASSAGAAASATAPSTSASSSDSPTVTAEDIEDLKEAARPLRWTRKEAREFFQGEFGCPIEKLTKAQAKRAHELLAELRNAPELVPDDNAPEAA